MKKEDLQLITRSNTANILLAHFSQRERISADTALEPLRTYLVRKGAVIDIKDFNQFFQELEDAGVGELEAFRGNPHGRFRWLYSLRDICDQVLFPNKQIELTPLDAQGHPTIRLVSRRLPRSSDLHIRQTENISNAPGLTFMFTTKQGQRVPLGIDDAERLIKEIKELKTRLG